MGARVGRRAARMSAAVPRHCPPALVPRAQVVAGGALSDWVSARAESRRLLVPAAGCALAAVCWRQMIDAQSFEAAMAWLALQYFVGENWFGSAVAVLQRQLPTEVQGGAQGVFSTLTVVGNVAPLAIGALEARSSLPEVLGVVVPALYVGSAALFAWTAVDEGSKAAAVDGR
mmetsp:Transcript_16218/g.54537  ORF Transcript_16218/g.54537 Transcript_16218/m.54537 type:complete len:173 (+) Transcript_16218:344-862(+)